MNDAKAINYVASNYPDFYAAVKDFPDLKLEAGLDDDELARLEQKLEIDLSDELRNFFRSCGALAMNGLSVGSRELGPIRMPNSDAWVVGYFYLYNAADRLLMLPGDDSIYYLEQHNGAVTKLAPSLAKFFNEVLPRRLYE